MTQQTKKQQLLAAIDDMLKNCDVTQAEPIMWVEVEAPELDVPEVISNPFRNFAAKRKYYNAAYNDDLQLIARPEIAIINWEVIQ